MLVLLSVLALTTCAPGYGAHPRTPAEGGDPWTEVETASFRVLSDLPLPDARNTALQLERTLFALTTVFEQPRVFPEKWTVVVFRNESNYLAFMPGHAVMSSWLAIDPERSRVIVSHGNLDWVRRPLVYSLMHDLLWRNLGPVPPWFEAGWCEYWSTIDVVGDQFLAGKRLPHWFSFPMSWVSRPSALIRKEREAFGVTGNMTQADQDALVATRFGAWGLMHMLHHGPESYRARLTGMLAEVRAGATVSQAWERQFADIPPARLDRDFDTYLHEGRFGTLATRLPQRAKEGPIVRQLDDAEIDVLWARLGSLRGLNAEVTLRDLDEAIGLSPSLASARYYRAIYHLRRRDLVSAERDVDAAVALAPDDPRARLARLALVERRAPTSQTPASRAELGAALSDLGRIARSTPELNAVAYGYLELGQLDRGIEFARRAVARDPIDCVSLENYASLLFASGAVREAVLAQRRAVAFIPEGARYPEAHADLARYERALGSSE